MQRHQSTILRPWQQDILNIITDDTSDRTIHWVVDYTGNTGKSFLCNYLHAMHNALTLTNTCARDIAYMYNNEPIVLFDFTRQVDLASITFNIMESLKNGSVFSGKYESQMKKFDPPVIMCFSNGLPDRSKLSLDRWNVLQIDNHTIEKLSYYNVPDICADTDHICSNK